MTLDQQIRAELARFYTDANDIQHWLTSPQSLLDGRIPARMIAIGEGEQVLDFLKEMPDGAFR